MLIKVLAALLLAEGKLWMPQEFPERFAVGGQHNGVTGADIVAATTIAPTHRVFQMGGATPVVNITEPWAGFGGEIMVIPTSAFTWTAAGNIGIAGTAVIGKAIIFVYHQTLKKWYPSVIA